MHIAWGSLMIVFLVSFAAAVAVAALVAYALVALSGRPGVSLGASTGHSVMPGSNVVSSSNRVVGGLCLAAAGLTVVYGLYVIMAA
jgi:hypothetical protein